MRTSWIIGACAAAALIGPAVAQNESFAGASAEARAAVSASVAADIPSAAETASQIFSLAELGYLETESTGLLQARLEEAGFEIEQGVADIPTAFIARYAPHGEGPVIAILAEYDALPGISQAAVAHREETPGLDAAHACGHHLFGAGSVAAARAVAEWLQASGTPGEIRVYGTPAEEGGSGKVYMVRAGLFDDVDVALHWHPDDENAANVVHNLANRSARFTFTGVASHAAAAPEVGRSALDGVEAMNFMVNMLREHVPQDARIHYVITQGGEAPNVVPDGAQSYYYVRHPDVDVLESVWERVIQAAEAGAAGTGTSVDIEVMHGNRPLLPLTTLQRRIHDNLVEVGGVTYDEAEQAFAEELYASFDSPRAELGAQETIQPFEERQAYGSTDVGDVSWATPTGGLRAATWVPGTSAHTWQAVAAGGTSIGHSGMAVAAETLALTAIDLFSDPELMSAVREEWEAARGPDFEYYALLGDREPPLDYRVSN